MGGDAAFWAAFGGKAASPLGNAVSTLACTRSNRSLRAATLWVPGLDNTSGFILIVAS